MIAGGELNKRQLAELKKALASMELPPKKRQRLLWRMAKYGVIAAAKRNVRNQETPDGEGWEGRKTKRKGKMLRNMPKLLHIREMPEIQAVRIYLQGGGYRNGETPVPAGTVGYSQQNGMRVRVSRASQPGRHSQARWPPLRREKNCVRWATGCAGEALEKAHYPGNNQRNAIRTGGVTYPEVKRQGRKNKLDYRSSFPRISGNG